MYTSKSSIKLSENSHSSVFNNASLVHLLSNPMNHKNNVCSLRGSVLGRGLFNITPVEPCSTAGGWQRREDRVGLLLIIARCLVVIFVQ